MFYKVFVLFLGILLAQLIPLSSLCQGLCSNKRGNKKRGYDKVCLFINQRGKLQGGKR